MGNDIRNIGSCQLQQYFCRLKRKDRNLLERCKQKTNFIEYWTFTVLGWVPYREWDNQLSQKNGGERRKNAISVETGFIWSHGKTGDTNCTTELVLEARDQPPLPYLSVIIFYPGAVREYRFSGSFYFVLSQSAEETTISCVLLLASLHNNWKRRSTWLTKHFYCNHMGCWGEN